MGTKGPGGTMPGTVSLPVILVPAPRQEEPALKDVLCAVNACTEFIVGFDSQLKSLKDELISMHQEMRKTVTALEERASTAEDTLYPLESKLRGLQEIVSLQAAKLDETENRLCRNNVRVIDLPERIYGGMA